MRSFQAAFIFYLAGTIGAVAQERERWSSLDPTVATALHAFRQSNHRIARAMAENLDGSRQGRDNRFGLPFNFAAARHLLFALRDLNGDDRPEVFLLFDWPYVRGTDQAHGVVMVQRPEGRWRIACSLRDWGRDHPDGGIQLLETSSHGWRDFRTSDGPYIWRPIPGAPGQMECKEAGAEAEPPSPRQSARQARRLPSIPGAAGR